MLQFLIDNKEIFFSGLGATIIGIIIKNKSSKKKKTKTIVNKYITNKTINNNNTTNNTTNTTNSHNNNNNNNNNNSHNRYTTSHNTKNQTTKKSIELTKIRLYSTGVKGKVYTNAFHKSLNHNFGIELTIGNNTGQPQKVKIGWCIYDNKGLTILKGTFYENVPAHNSFKKDFYVKEDAFRKLKTGKYKSQFWINDKKVQKEHFTIAYK